MAELDKLKRRIIRLAARKLITEKKSHDDVWKELKTEAGIDCEVLWRGMRALTLKKISRLLPACDLTENIPPVARMSLTDWLLFDLVLVHEDIDLIGQDKKNQKDPKPLIELMFIVHTLNIEGKSGDALVNAWTKATVTYNGRRRRCSPMLLQKRWHQLKEATRSNFYNFWFSYRGSDKLLLRAKNQYMPSKLQMAIAQRYTHIITKPFMDWNECIEKKFVILPDDFEKKMRSPQEILKESDLQPDIMLVEPTIETIELNDGDSDTEKGQEDSNNSQNSISKTSNNIGPNTIIKTEPVDEEKIKKPTIFSLSDQLLKRDEQLLSNMNNFSVQVINNDELVNCISTNKDSGTNINIKSGFATDNNSDDDIIDVTDDKGIPSTENPELGSKKYRFDSNVEDITAIDTEIIQIETDVCLSPSKELEMQIVMPQITSVFGNVNDDTDVLAQLSNFTTNKTIDEFTSVVPVDKESDLQVAINDKLGSYLGYMKKTPVSKGMTYKLNSVPIKEAESKEAIENIPQMNSDSKNPFLDLPPDLTFMDGSIELIDDGIEFVDDEIDLKKDDDSTAQAIDLCNSTDEENDDTENFDVKLLMDPIVYTTKLEDMKVFTNKSNQYIMDKNVLYSAVVESKPKSARSVDNLKIKQNDNADYPITENKDEIYSHESSDSEDSIVESKRVKLSSPLLQKPKSRSYNPIQLCKNPDFNTRLKRLTVGFLSSMRNRSLLRTLKPVTIDISNAFETKLVKGTMYLKSSDTNCDVLVGDNLSEKISAVMPSAMPAQSLIDHAKVNIQDILPSHGNKTNNAKPNESIFPQRNKAINLPDIENIRRMNQHLFTAEITPMRVQTASEYCKPPVQLVASSSNNEQVIASPSSLISTRAPKITNIIDLHDSRNINLPKHSQISHLISRESSISNYLSSIPRSSSDKEPVKQSSQKHRKTHVPSWLSKPFFPKGLKVDSGLLTIDALQKMLSVMKEGRLISENFKDAMLASVIHEIELQHLKKEGNSPNQKPTESETKKAPEESRPVPLLIKIPPANKHCDKPNISTANSNCNETYSSVTYKNYNKPKIAAPNKHCKEPGIPSACKDFNIKLNAKEMPKITPIKPKPYSNDNKIQVIVEEKGKDCCWARKKLNNPSTRARHNCHSICFCCCRKEFVAECTAQFAKIKQKSLNVNRIQNISDFGHTSPIFLGKNNILLTNAPLPKEMSILPVLQKKMTTDHVVVPQGVQIMLLSNGQLSYTLEPGVKLTNEELATLPAILKAARQQLSPSIMNTSATKSDDVYHIEDAEINHTSEPYTNSVQDVTGKAMPVLPVLQKKVTTDLIVPKGVQIVLLSNGQLSYTLEPGVKLTKEELATLPTILEAARGQLSPSILNDISSKSNTTYNECIPAPYDASKIQDDKKVREDNIDINLECNTTSNKGIPTTDHPSKIQDDKQVKSDNNSHPLESNVTSNKNLQDDAITNQNRKLVAGHSTGIPTQCNTTSNEGVSTTDGPIKLPEEEKCLPVDKIPFNTNNSNLLSDLMEMSGISSEDTTFVTTEPTVPPLIPLMKTPPAPQTPPRYLQIAANAPPVITTNPSSDVQELCSITSYAHLKYAFEKNAKFFKLDLQSGAVLPIKVSLKKDLTATAFNISAQKPLPQFIDLTDEQDTPHKLVSETENNDDITSPIITEPVRPLKLLRSPNILQKNRANAANKDVRKSNMSQVPRGQKRKQNHEKSFMRMDTEIGNDAIKDSTSHDRHLFGEDVLSSELSDDEPLASVVKRRKQIQNIPKKDKENGFIDMEGVISANIISTLRQSSCFVFNQQNENTQNVQDTKDKEQNFNDIGDKKNGQDTTHAQRGQERQDVENGQDIQEKQDAKGRQDVQGADDGQDTDDGQDAEDIQENQVAKNTQDVDDGQDVEDGQDKEKQVSKDTQDVDDGQEMEDEQDVDDGQDMGDDQDNYILGF